MLDLLCNALISTHYFYLFVGGGVGASLSYDVAISLLSGVENNSKVSIIATIVK